MKNKNVKKEWVLPTSVAKRLKKAQDKLDTECGGVISIENVIKALEMDPYELQFRTWEGASWDATHHVRHQLERPANTFFHTTPVKIC